VTGVNPRCQPVSISMWSADQLQSSSIPTWPCELRYFCERHCQEQQTKACQYNYLSSLALSRRTWVWTDWGLWFRVGLSGRWRWDEMTISISMLWRVDGEISQSFSQCPCVRFTLLWGSGYFGSPNEFFAKPPVA